MDNEIKVIRAKQTHTLVIFFCALILIIVAYVLFGSLTKQMVSSIEGIRNDVEQIRKEYRPIVRNFNASMGEAGHGVKQLAGTSEQVINQLSSEIPKTMSASINGLKTEYNTTHHAIKDEYTGLKSAVAADYQSLKAALVLLNADIRQDVDWMKSEIAAWRTLFAFVAFVFGVIVVLTSIQDVLANLRWLLSFVVDAFKQKS